MRVLTVLEALWYMSLEVARKCVTDVLRKQSVWGFEVSRSTSAVCLPVWATYFVGNDYRTTTASTQPLSLQFSTTDPQAHHETDCSATTLFHRLLPTLFPREMGKPYQRACDTCNR